jgi:DNA replication and repair protein RecF
MIKELELKNFRRFKNLKLSFNSNIVIIHGDNAKGKSTILESIYVISNGRSPWAQTEDLVNNAQGKKNRHMRIEIEREDENRYIYFKDENRKQYQINGKRTTPKKFFEENSATIFNPEQIEILMISSSERRNFVDEIIGRIDYSYYNILRDFRKVLRQRNAYLKRLSKLFYENGTIARNDPVLSVWTSKFVDLSSEITEKRKDICKKLSKKNFEVRYISEIEDFNNIKEELTRKIEENKKRDIATGYTNTGAHREDWEIHNHQDIKKYGSRGQKRMAVGQLVFMSQDVFSKENGFYPTLLLDDISSELDKENTKEVLNKELLEKQQTFITVIDLKHIPKDILNRSQVIDISSF